MVIYTSLACYQHIFKCCSSNTFRRPFVNHFIATTPNPSINWDLQLNFDLLAFWKRKLEDETDEGEMERIEFNDASVVENQSTQWHLLFACLWTSSPCVCVCAVVKTLLRKTLFDSHFNRIPTKIWWNFNWPIFNWCAWDSTTIDCTIDIVMHLVFCLFALDQTHTTFATTFWARCAAMALSKWFNNAFDS